MARFTLDADKKVLHLELVSALQELQPGEAMAYADLHPALEGMPGGERSRRIDAAAKAGNVYIVRYRHNVQRANPADQSILAKVDQRHARVLNGAKRLQKECEVATGFTDETTPTVVHARLSNLAGIAGTTRALLAPKKTLVSGATKASLPLAED